MTGWAELERFLQTDPRDVGCEQALHVLHVYVELVLDDAWGELLGPRRRAATPESRRTCSPAARAPRTTGASWPPPGGQALTDFLAAR